MNIRSHPHLEMVDFTPHALVRIPHVSGVMKLPLSNDAIAKLRLTAKTCRIRVWDTRQPGLEYEKGRRGGTFHVNMWRRGRNHREKLGDAGTLSIADARVAAQIARGKNAEHTQRHRRTGPTLKVACERYAQAKLKRQTSIDTFNREMSHHLEDWTERSLRSITAQEVRDRHAEIAETSGPYVANRVMRQLSAVWQYIAAVAILDDMYWPHVSPTQAVAWCPQAPRAEPILMSQLAKWRTGLEALTPIRRLYNLIVLLTGLRRSDAATLRRDHLNLTDSVTVARIYDPSRNTYGERELPPFSMIRPAPKGGARYACVLPLSKVVVELLTRALAERTEDDGGWVFPARSIKARHCANCADLGLPPHAERGVAHMAEPKERDLPSPHRLRDTFASAAIQANVIWLALKRLLNHAVGGDITERYLRPDFELLREQLERVTAFLCQKMALA